MKEAEPTNYEEILNIIESVQDFGVVGGMGDIVSNTKLAEVLSERGCIVVKPMPNIRRKRYSRQ